MIEIPSIPNPTEIRGKLSEAGGALLNSLANRLVGAVMLKNEPLENYPGFRVGNNGNSVKLEVNISEEEIKQELNTGRD